MRRSSQILPSLSLIIACQALFSGCAADPPREPDTVIVGFLETELSESREHQRILIHKAFSESKWNLEPVIQHSTANADATSTGSVSTELIPDTKFGPEYSKWKIISEYLAAEIEQLRERGTTP